MPITYINTVYLIGGGGGGGGGTTLSIPNTGGGGGAGAVIQLNNVPVVVDLNYSLTIGTGGAAGTGDNVLSNGSDGGITYFLNNYAIGGGGGGGGGNGLNGGSGGGGGGSNSWPGSSPPTGGLNVGGIGFPGGTGNLFHVSELYGGGGGGAGGAGQQNFDNSNPNAGGTGMTINAIIYAVGGPNPEYGSPSTTQGSGGNSQSIYGPTGAGPGIAGIVIIYDGSLYYTYNSNTTIAFDNAGVPTPASS
jgi:hypothetical protein